MSKSPASLPPEEPALVAAMVSPLLEWYRRCARQLPWREDPSPYRVWLSEIMLQQTRVEAVKPYFDRFLKALPDIPALAAAPEEQLLKLWEGLGYYNRARNLQKAARLVVEQYGGELPASYQRLLELPGIGEYTAGAIASIAFGIPVPAVDGNVLRVLSRVLASREDVTDPRVKARFRELLCRAEPRGEPEYRPGDGGRPLGCNQPGDFNQSLMELGATVCLPNGAPQCLVCPLAALCRGREEGCAGELPVKPPKKQRKQQHRTVLLLLDGGRVLLHRRPSRGLLAGLWELPSAEGTLTPQEAGRAVSSLACFAGFPPPVAQVRPAGEAVHLFTHLQWQLTGYLVELSPGPAKTIRGEDWAWATRRQLEAEYPLPSAFRTYRALLERII